MTDERGTEGWVDLANSRKYHYVGADGRSLCGRWLYLGKLFTPDEQFRCHRLDECVPCRRSLTKRAAKAAT